ncbi:hypothetical protein GIB67_027872 [Kingdonia uniflora]|uniref:Methylthioribose-1-phosphate isomerase n=1 Tax=Kingdonia uniflora TaxID=39325 RepID=A0A7J7LGR1_9MAGN|nr:hypothetical protein GIB67_027872 [Kingdonia uniflora]
MNFLGFKYLGLIGVLPNESLKIIDGKCEGQPYLAYIESAEIMLNDDVASNKEIGSHGTSFLQHNLNGSKNLSILTHCNTGSLATVGYGTAFGVIRAVHTERFLERAFCTETRPFNQGYRLTAFELVHDKIPATLIADCAEVTLMKNGSVDTSIVGADRVAANGIFLTHC